MRLCFERSPLVAISVIVAMLLVSWNAQVYLKLPAYTSAEALEAKLLHAITEGQDHFALD